MNLPDVNVLFVSSSFDACCKLQRNIKKNSIFWFSYYKIKKRIDSLLDKALTVSYLCITTKETYHCFSYNKMCQTKYFTWGMINVLLSPCTKANVVLKAKQKNVKRKNITMKKF